MADGDLLALQVAPEAVRPSATKAATGLLLAPQRAADRLRHFPEEVYDLSAESHLSRFLKVLLGEAGAGQLRKRLLIQQMQSTLQGSHFFNLDRFYGPLFGMRRNPDEVLGFDPHSSNATREQWDFAHAKDASFRSRIEQFSRALTFGPTPTGIELVAEALLSVDCDVYESYLQADESYQTYAELETQYGDNGTYNEMEGTTYATLEGEGLARMSGDERRTFIVRPKRRISLAEAYDLTRVLSRLKPADTRFTIDYTGIPLHAPLTIREAVADSVHWEVIPRVSSPQSALDPYQVQSGTPVEQPRPPFSGYQGEAWSYIGSIAGVVAYSQALTEDKPQPMPAQRVTFYDGSSMDFSAEMAVLPKRLIQAGRSVSDAILVSHPYTGTKSGVPVFQNFYSGDPDAVTLANLYADGIPLEPLNRLLETQPDIDPFQQNPQHRFWVTPERPMEDPTTEVMELRFQGDRLVNYISFEMVQFPHEAIVEVYDTEGTSWNEVFRRTITDSVPAILTEGAEVSQREGHPQHSLPQHWTKVSEHIPSVQAGRIRVRLQRTFGNPPMMKARSVAAGQVRTARPVPYSLALRSLDVGYRVTSREDFDGIGPDEVLGSSTDIAGSKVEFVVQEQTADRVLDNALTAWRSEPQPVGYAVVNLYLDVTDENDNDAVIDRFYLDPTHAGPHLTIYYSNDPQVSDGTDAFFEDLSWTPVPRDYTLQKGYVHLPPTRARYFKFEFTNLVAEPYESFVAIDRKVKLFPPSLVEAMHRKDGHAEDSMLAGMRSAVDVSAEQHYKDALDTLAATTRPPGTHRPTEALYVKDLHAQEAMHDRSWVFGFLPWHQDAQAPRFHMKGRHHYEVIDVRHRNKVAFFVGLRTVEAYRTKWEEDEDATVYFDTFDDFRNLTEGFTWAFEPGSLSTVGTDVVTTPVVATSRTFSSLHNVEAIQFATEQSSAVQIVPDHDFRDPALGDYTWDDPDNFLRVGDAQLIYSANDHSVTNIRYVIPPTRPLLGGGMVRGLVAPVFSYRPSEVSDEAAAAATEGGVASPLLGLSPAGRAYAAVRFTLNSELSEPFYLQVVDGTDDTVLAEKPISPRRGETIEEYLAFDIPGPNTTVRVRFIQRGKSNDTWKVDTLSMFDDSILWEFSVNGGGDWYPAQGIRNNDNGILTFPAVGNQLRYRVTAYRPNLWVSAVKLRPHYVGTKNARPTGTHRGPNVSVYDQDVPIHEDPLFTSWKKPVPYWWFAASRRFPILPVEGVPNVTEFARFYGRPVSETVPEVTDEAERLHLHVRSGTDWIPMEGDIATRPLPLTWRLVRPVVSPVGQGEADYGN